MTYDLVIVGAGVASAAALITLKDSKLKIGVVAPNTRPSFRIGETLGPAGVNELRKLNVKKDFNEEYYWPSFQKFSCWGNNALIPTPHYGTTNQSWYLDRVKFEAHLWQEAQKAEFDHKISKVIRARQEDDLWQIQTSVGTVSSRMLLDVSGRSAVVARNYLSRERHDKLVAAFVVLDQKSEDVEATQATLIEAMPNGWFYSVLIPGNRLVVTWFTDSDFLPDNITRKRSVLEELISQSIYTRKRIETAGFEMNQIPKVVDASTVSTNKIATNNLFTAGDAASCFDPLSSHGITTALWSGRRIAESILSLENGSKSNLEAYINSFHMGIQKYLQEKKDIYGKELRFKDHPFWNRRCKEYTAGII